MEREVIQKQMLVGLSRRSDWQEKLTLLFNQVMDSVHLELNEEEALILERLIDSLTHLIYSGGLQSIETVLGDLPLRFDIIYYPDEEDEDDLDVTLLDIIDMEADRIVIILTVDDLEWAKRLCERKLEIKSNSRVTLKFAELTNDDAEPEKDDTGDGFGDEELIINDDELDPKQKEEDDGNDQ
ncbi:hypothetical protein BVY01_05245 [bacterium I07]|nr:hypothetical protein BVY01_05245 [bacterium I07]